MKTKILLILCVLFGLMMVNAGLNKFFNYMPMPEDITDEQMALFGAFGTIKWLMPLVAVVEIVGGILFMIPKYRAFGALVILPVMVGIIVHHAVHEPSTMGIALVMFIINIWVLIDNREKYAPIFK
ncbi:MAG: DoxX family protein [Flavobacteriaceae bacterium]|nr:DoxX family protein [Mangrovimonas sp.]MCB0431975.1 DoxX family protein [Mangrovimonas sp.]MCB0435533.1 DoxX family protein [Mangrovimonas sp.]MCB0438496.1 DoxX family protein [Mangrovimonas sp.]HRV54186.1 DoxX family protein [Mangrovimonas sp.]